MFTLSPATPRLLSLRAIHYLASSATSHSPTCELDTHADTCVAGSNCILLSRCDRTVSVYAFSQDYAPQQNIPIGTVATVWVHPRTGVAYLLVIHEALFFGDRMAHTLLNPNQLRAHGLAVYDTPTQFDLGSPHHIHDPVTDVTIPLYLRGVISYFDSHLPTSDDVHMLPRITLTSPHTWDPNAPSFAEAEEQAKIRAERSVSSLHKGATAWDDTLIVPAAHSYDNAFCGIAKQEEPLLELSDDIDLHRRLVDSVHVSPNDLAGTGECLRPNPDAYSDAAEKRELMELSTTERRSVITPEALSKRWGIGLATAKRTLRATTQRGVRDIHVSAERRTRHRAPWLKLPNVRG